MKKLLLLPVFLLGTIIVKAQIPTFYYEKKDAFYHYPSLRSSQVIQTKTMPGFDIDKLLEEDKEKEGIVGPFRFGYVFEVNYSLKDGTWEELETVRIWRMKFVSPGAYSLNFVFNELYLTQDAQLYIFNTKGTMIYGPVIAKYNLSDEKFLTDLIAGDEVIIQLTEPKTGKEQSRLKISSVVHGYKNTFPFDIENSPKVASLTCHKDVTCSTWLKESDGVALILINPNSFCTGSLLNNTSQNYLPFVLTAFHCLDGDCNGNLSSAEKNAVGSWNFKFQYKSLSCGGSTYSSINYPYSDFRAAWYDSDFALVEMKSSVTDSRISFLGWDISGSSSTTATTIHHPQGDLMKISKDIHIPVTNSSDFSVNLNCGNSLTVPANTHWIVTIDTGSVEKGSSGAPLFNTDKRVIGQLHAGEVKCPIATTYFGQFHKSWSGNGSSDTQLSHWLNPSGSIVSTTNTIRYPVISGPSTVCTSSVVYTITDLLPGSSVVWTYDTNLLNLTPGSGNATVSAKSGIYGNAWIRATINGSIVLDKTIIANFPPGGTVEYVPLSVYQVYNVYPPNNIPDVTGWDWSWMPGANYPGASLTPYNDHATVSFTTSGGYSLFAKAKNKCGTSPSPQIIYTFTAAKSSPGNPFAYPNPVSDILKIDVDAYIAYQIQSGQLQQSASMYDIRLYDGKGIVVNQTKVKSGIVQFNVSNLPDGIYYLHIYDGVSAKPETVPIIVNH